jgi:hypothetical protein
VTIQVSKPGHDQALHYLARWREYELSPAIRNQLTEVVLGTGRCDEEAARRGMEWVREQCQRSGCRSSVCQ